MSIRHRTLDRFVGDTDDVLLSLLDHMIWPILALVVLGVLITVPQTLSGFTSIQLILWGGVPVGLLVLAESICLLSGHFDLSIGAIAGFAGMLTGMVIGDCPSCWGLTDSALAGFALIIAVGVVIGFVNGVMVGKYDINPFLQTLSFLIIFQGARTALSTQPATGLPELYTMPGGSPNIAIGIMLLAFLVFGLVFRYTRFGQAVYATGSDDHAAREVGISTTKVIIAVYTISGVLSARCSAAVTARLSVWVRPSPSRLRSIW